MPERIAGQRGAHDRGNRHNMQCRRMLKEQGIKEPRPAI
jgi:hypothetical protein